MKKTPVFSKIFLTRKPSFILHATLLFLMFFISPCFSAPRVSVKIEEDRVLANKPFTLILEIFWKGTADDFMVEPPVPELPEKLEQTSSSFLSEATENKYHLIYRYTLKPSEEGNYKIAPVEVKYWAKGEDTENTLLTEEIPFEVKKFSYISSPFTLVLLFIFLIIFIMVLYVFIRDKRKLKKKKGQCDSDLPDKDNLLKTYAECKRCKTEGDMTGFYRTAIDVLTKTSAEEGMIIDDLKSVCEKVEFGNYRPASEEIEPVFRRITRAMENTFSDKKNYELEYKKYCK